MNLVDKRFKVNRVLKNNIRDSVYEVVDFWDDDKKLFMKLYDSEREAKVIDYFIENFIKLSRIKHKHLLTSEHFSILKTIDGKKVISKQYYSTSEYIDATSLEKAYVNLTLEDRLNIILQICTVLDFIHYKGIVYKHLSPTNIFLQDDGNIKVADLATVYENFLSVKYDNLTRFFIAPEIILQQENSINYNSDKYSLGKVMLYLLTDNFYKEDSRRYDFKEIFQINVEQADFLDEIIRRLTNRNPSVRNIELKDLVDKIKKMFNIDYEYDLIEERGILNFETQIVGREDELEEILKIDRDYIENRNYKKTLLITGDRGVGKTRFLNEATYLLRMRGREVYNVEITPSNSAELAPIADILRQVMKDTPSNILDKYIREFSGILPELKLTVNNQMLTELDGKTNRLRLYDRITNYFDELAKTKEGLMYLIIDNIEEANIEFIILIDYIMKNLSNSNLMLIISLNKKIIPQNSTKFDILKSWINEEDIKIINITNLNLNEIGEYIQHILGVNYKPIKFSTAIIRESKGNPKYIEYMIKGLYAEGELYFDSDGFWKVKANKYSDIYFPSSMDEAMKNQLGIIEKEYMDVMKVVSAYKSSISKIILSHMVELSSTDLNKKLQDLASMRLIDEVVMDWGYSYSINNIQLKNLIYYRIHKDERVEIHRKIAELLNNYYEDNYKVIMEELVYHLVASNQREDALGIIVEEANSQQFMYGTQSLLLWEEAYEIAKNINTHYKIDILRALGKIYFMRGENDKSLNIYEELYKESVNVNKLEFEVVADLGIAEIYVQRGLLKLALEKVNDALKISESIGYDHGIVKSKILYCKILLNNSGLEDLEKTIEDLLESAVGNNLSEELGIIYNFLGLLEYFKGNIEYAIINYEISIQYFHESNEPIDSTKPLNNLGNIYSDRGEYGKSMKYYEDALNVANKYGTLNLKLVFLNNIGEVYFKLYDYDKAIKCLEEARNIAMDIGDVNGTFISNANLGLVYLNKNDYRKSYNCYINLKNNCLNYENITHEVLSQTYDFLSEFCTKFGKWDEAKIWTEKAIEMFKEYNIFAYLISRARLAFINYYSDGKYDREIFEKIRAEFRANCSSYTNYNRRNFLIQLSLIAFLQRDYSYVLDLLNEDDKLQKNYQVLSLDYKKDALIHGIRNNKDSYIKLIKLEEDLKKYNLLDIEIFVNLLLGNNSFKNGEYYQSYNYLSEVLDLIHRLIKSVSDIDMQISYLKRVGADQIKTQLAEVIYSLSGEKSDYMKTDDIYTEDDIDVYFNDSSILKLMKDDQFTKLAESNFLYDEVKDINDIETLMIKLKDDYEYNLELILKFLARETLSQKGYILVYDDVKNEYVPIIGLVDDLDFEPNQSLLSLANRYDEGILLSTSLESNIIGLYKELLPRNTKAIICVPIRTIVDSDPPSSERRKLQYSYDKNIGYIYLETDRLINRFDEKRHNLTKTLLSLLYINIENYKLKILSTIDRLTSTHTRKHFESEFNNSINEAKGNQKTFGVMMIDIDNFKVVNDTYGHRTGDTVLSKIGNYIMKNVRKTDVVARYGGEEFVIILKDIGEDEAIKIGEKIREGVSQLKISNIEYPITISIGLSLFPKHSQFKEELIVKADQALYNAKEQGKNKVEVWNANLSNSLNRVDRLAGIISGNINTDQRNILAILDVINIVKDDISKEERIYSFLGSVIKTVEAKNCSFIELNNNKEISDTYARTKKNKEWVKNPSINKEIVNRVINNKKGEFLIDWENTNEIDIVLNVPNWQSVIAIPLIINREVIGVGYVTVPIKEKEFDYNSYNLVKILWDIFSMSI